MRAPSFDKKAMRFLRDRLSKYCTLQSRIPSVRQLDRSVNEIVTPPAITLETANGY
jgi:hypothetical protein